MPINVGQPAPDFELSSTIGEGKVKLSDFKGKKNVVLFFFPLAFSPVCANEMPNFEKHIAELTANDTVFFSVSVDSLYTLKAFAGHCKVSQFPMLSDFHPKGDVAKKYGVYADDHGIAQRATIIIDKQGVVRFTHVNELVKERDLSAFLDVLKSL